MPEQEAAFQAEVKIAGINLYIEVPEHIILSLKDGPQAAVLIRLAPLDQSMTGVYDGAGASRLERNAKRLIKVGRLTADGWFRTTLVPLKTGSTRLYLNSWMREEAGVGVGEWVNTRLRSDPGSREITMPAALAEALAQDERAATGWEALKSSRRREIVTYLTFLKTPVAVRRNVEKVMNQLSEAASNPEAKNKLS